MKIVTAANGGEEMKNNIWRCIIVLLGALLFTGCGYLTEQPELFDAKTTKELYERITDDVLYDGERGDIRQDNVHYFKYIDEFDTASAAIVALGTTEDKSVCAFGLEIDEEQAILLDIEGEKVYLPFSFRNQYNQYPKLKYVDIDEDGQKEVIFSQIIVTGNPWIKYQLLVCDKEESWRAYEYNDYLSEVEKLIRFTYEEQDQHIIFSSENGQILYDAKMPAWTEQYPFNGKVDFDGYVRFDALEQTLTIEPFIVCENSLPFRPIQLVFDVIYHQGQFDLSNVTVQVNPNAVSEAEEKYASSISVPEDMLAVAQMYNQNEQLSEEERKDTDTPEMMHAGVFAYISQNEFKEHDQEFPDEETFLGAMGFAGQEPFYEYDNPDGSPRLLLYYDPTTGEGCGIRYYRRWADEWDTTGVYGFAFAETQTKKWEGFQTDYSKQLSIAGDTGASSVLDYKENYEYDDMGNVVHFDSGGEIDWLEDASEKHMLLEMDYEYDGNGIMRHRAYRHNGYVFGTTYMSWETYFDADGRPEYEDIYITHGTFERYYIYTEASVTPLFELELDDNLGLWIPEFTYFNP